MTASLQYQKTFRKVETTHATYFCRHKRAGILKPVIWTKNFEQQIYQFDSEYMNALGSRWSPSCNESRSEGQVERRTDTVENQRNIFAVIASDDRMKRIVFYGRSHRCLAAGYTENSWKTRWTRFARTSRPAVGRSRGGRWWRRLFNPSGYSREPKLNNREVIWPSWIVWRDKVQLIPGNCREHEPSVAISS